MTTDADRHAGDDAGVSDSSDASPASDVTRELPLPEPDPPGEGSDASPPRRRHRAVTREPRRCEVCDRSFQPTRSTQTACGATCRQRRRRGTVVLTSEEPYDVTEEDRAWIRRAVHESMVELGLDQVVLTPEIVRAHILATAVRVEE